MFKDYYRILGISSSASDSEIKSAYRKMSMKWHPDKNPDLDVTKEMQDINEAYAILKDHVKKARYDIEYQRFYNTYQCHKHNEQKEKDLSKEENSKKYNCSYEYDIQDENLKEDIKSARKYAEDLVDKFLRELKKTSKTAAKGAVNSAIQYAIAYILAGVIILIIGSLIKSCN